MKHVRIILTGFMGTGKTAVGQALAKRLSYEFLDTDLMVEKETGKTITEIFEKEGESSFRAYEKKMVKKALEKEKVVVATGGGAITDTENLKLMKERGVVIGLAASPDVILERVQRFDTRPLMKTKDQLKKIQSLLSQRSPYYREADRIIDTTAKRVEETIEEILKALE
jgi:shikimate kinase